MLPLPSLKSGSASALRPKSPTVVLAVSGSIAAYKAVVVARLLIKAGVRVIPVMTRSAEAFVGAATLSGICGEAVRSDMFDTQTAGTAGEIHVDLARDANLVLVVPATADLLARMAVGRADDLVTALLLCASSPVLIAPAMHPRMWSHPATKRNVRTIETDGRVVFMGPVDGEVASGESGIGRMAEPEVIVAVALAQLGKRDFSGKHVVVTAGPTVEDIDPVRFVDNRSSGKMGFAIAERAALRGATVTLVAGPVSLPTPHGVRRLDVRSAVEMQSALRQTLGKDLDGADALVMTAAVSDYRPRETQSSKIKRAAAPLTMHLVPNPDLLAEIGHSRRGTSPFLVGFAVETDTDGRVVASAKKKLTAKRVDLVVANHADDAFGTDDNRATLVSSKRVEPLARMAKRDLADRILDRVQEAVTARMARVARVANVARPAHKR